MKVTKWVVEMRTGSGVTRRILDTPLDIDNCSCTKDECLPLALHELPPPKIENISEVLRNRNRPTHKELDEIEQENKNA